MTTYQNCPVCQNINGMGVLDCDGHDDDPPECTGPCCAETLPGEQTGTVDDDYIHYNPGTPHECKPALTVFGDRWVCQYNWCARYLGDAE